MGLDGVELIMDVEDTFDIQITDEEATGCLTVGDLYECVKKKVDFTRNPKKCLTQMTFNSIRKVFVDNFGVSRKAVAPKAKTDTFLPITKRRETWALLSEKTQFDLPRLELPSALVLFYCILCVILIAVTFAMTWHNGYSLFGISAVWIVFFATVVRWISSPLAVVVPARCNSVGDLAKTVISMNFRKMNESLGENELWDMVTTLVSVQLGVEKNDLKPETQFVRDLNMD